MIGRLIDDIRHWTPRRRERAPPGPSGRAAAGNGKGVGENSVSSSVTGPPTRSRRGGLVSEIVKMKVTSVMKIQCEREKLLHAFQTAASVAPSRSPKPILQNLKLEVGDGKGILMGTDLEVGIRIEVEGITVDAPGSVVLPITRFLSILRESTDEVLVVDSLTAGRSASGGQRGATWQSDPSENPDEFPAVAVFDEARYDGELPAAVLSRDRPPNRVRDGCREQPLRACRRAAGTDPRTTLRPWPPTAAGSPGRKARRRRSASWPPATA